MLCPTLRETWETLKREWRMPAKIFVRFNSCFHRLYSFWVSHNAEIRKQQETSLEKYVNVLWCDVSKGKIPLSLHPSLPVASWWTDMKNEKTVHAPRCLAALWKVGPALSLGSMVELALVTKETMKQPGNRKAGELTLYLAGCYTEWVSGALLESLPW